MPGRTPAAPDRIAWCLDLLDVAPDDRVLEVGCGPGVAATLVADRLTRGCVTAIDRSATAMARARARAAHYIASGRLVLEQAALAEFRSDTTFDAAFGVNVNVFWTTPAEAECRVLAEVLVPGGAVRLVYDVPGRRAAEVGDRVAATLGRQRLDAVVEWGPRPSLVCITGRRPT